MAINMAEKKMMLLQAFVFLVCLIFFGCKKDILGLIHEIRFVESRKWR